MPTITGADLHRFIEAFPDFSPGPAIRLSEIQKVASHYGFSSDNFCLFQNHEGSLDFGPASACREPCLLTLREMFLQAEQNEMTVDPCIVFYVTEDTNCLCWAILEAAYMEGFLYRQQGGIYQ